MKQRQQLKSDFKTFLGRDLVKDLIDETSSDFMSSLEALMMTREEFDAFSFHKAIAGLGTDGMRLLVCFVFLKDSFLNSLKIFKSPPLLSY